MPQDIYDEMAAAWPSKIVARREIGRFTGGALSARYMANLDCVGEGPGKIRIGPRMIAYRLHDLVAWLRQRAAEQK